MSKTRKVGTFERQLGWDRCAVCASKRRVTWVNWECRCEAGEDAAAAQWRAAGRPPELRQLCHWHAAYMCVYHRNRSWDFIARAMPPEFAMLAATMSGGATFEPGNASGVRVAGSTLPGERR